MSLEILQNIVWKLKKLDCPVIANREDSWIKELLFTNSNCRLQLLEWFLLEIYSGLSEESSSTKLLNSPGEKGKHLLSSFSCLGFCKKEEHDLIKGYSKKTEQLYFWQKLTDVLWEKYQTTQKLHGMCDVSLSGAISTEHRRSCTVLEQIVSAVNMKDLLVEEIPLFPPDVSEYAEEMISTSVSAQEMKRLNIPTLEELKSQVGESNSVVPCAKNISTFAPSESCRSYFDSTNNERKISIANQLSSALNDLHDNCQKFDDAYSQLKPVLKIPAEVGTDSGPAFERICGKLESLESFLSDVRLAKEATSCLESLVSDDTSLKSNISLNLQKCDMQDYVTTIQGSLNRLLKDGEKEIQGA